MERIGSRPPRLLLAIVGLLAAASLIVGSAPVGAQEPELAPIVFVHGGAGSAAQYETQSRRFDGNGYPARLVRAFEYDSSFATNTFAQVIERLDAFVDVLRADHGVEQVYLVGHSLGTFVSNSYLADAGPRREDRQVHRDRRLQQPDLRARRARARLHGHLAGNEHDRQCRRQQRPPEPADPRPGGDVRRVVRGAVRVLHRRAARDDARAAGATWPGPDLGPRRGVPAERRRRRRHAGGVAGRLGDRRADRIRAARHADRGDRRQLGPRPGQRAAALRALRDPRGVPRAPLLLPAVAAQQQPGAAEPGAAELPDRGQHEPERQPHRRHDRAAEGVVDDSSERAERRPLGPHAEPEPRRPAGRRTRSRK